MDRDGTKAGFDVELTRAIADAVSIPVIASGGVGTLEHLVDGVRDGHASAVLAASIFHFGTYSIPEAKAYMAKAGLAMRLELRERLSGSGELAPHVRAALRGGDSRAKRRTFSVAALDRRVTPGHGLRRGTFGEMRA